MGRRGCLLKSVAAGMVFGLCGLPLWAGSQAEVVGFRLSETPERTRLVFDLDNPVEHKLFTLSKPERVVLDIQSAALRTELPESVPETAIVKRIRSAPRDMENLRVVLDLAGRARPKSFLLPPEGQAGYRLVIDLLDREHRSRVIKSLPQNGDLRDVVVAIDAGHGGKDPGAVGRRGTYEKDVVLAVARELARQVQAERGMKAVLIRDGDYYVGLRERINKARAHKADLFLSIHADAFKNPHAHGSSVYALSLSGATSEAAAWLADRENASELIGGVKLDDKDDLVAAVLLDLSQTATIQASLDAGREILKELGRQGQVHKASVQQAGFLVLKSPDIPSVLIETAFISNPDEERKLLSRQHRRQMAASILKGVKRYFARRAPPGTLLAEQGRDAGDGETLSVAGR